MMNKLKKFLDSHEFLWFILTFVLFAVFYTIFNFGILKTSYLHAEDGGRFLNEYFKYGLKSFLIPNGGYLCTISRIFIVISVQLASIFNNVNLIGNGIEVCSILFTSIIFSYFSSKEFENIIPSRFLRIIISLFSISFFCDYVGAACNGVGIHWLCGFLSFIVGINLLNDKLPSKWIIPMLFICILSSVSSLIIAFGIIYCIFNKLKSQPKVNIFKRFSKKEYFLFISILLLALVQIYFIMFGTSVVSESDSNMGIIGLLKTIKNSGKFTLAAFVLPFGVDLVNKLFAIGLLKYVEFALLIVVTYISIKNAKQKYLCYALLSIFTLSFMVFYKHCGSSSSEYYVTLIKDQYTFYKIMPNLIMLILYGILIDKIKVEPKYYVIVFVIICFIIANNYKNKDPFMDLSRNQYIDKISKYVDFSSSKYVSVPCEPYNWNWEIYLPVNDKYCEAKKCVERKNILIDVFECDEDNKCKVAKYK